MWILSLPEDPLRFLIHCKLPVKSWNCFDPSHLTLMIHGSNGGLAGQVCCFPVLATKKWCEHWAIPFTLGLTKSKLDQFFLPPTPNIASVAGTPASQRVCDSLEALEAEATYIMRCVQKAASLRKHDVPWRNRLWAGAKQLWGLEWIKFWFYAVEPPQEQIHFKLWKLETLKSIPNPSKRPCWSFGSLSPALGTERSLIRGEASLWVYQ